MTDDEVYYFLGKRKIESITKSNTAVPYEKIKLWRTYDINNREFVINLAKQHLKPILPAEQEIIPRKEWDLEGLYGATEKQLLHPHFDRMIEHFARFYTPRHNIAVISLCASTKPYRENPYINWYWEKSKDFADYFIISNPGMIPIEYDNYYPYRYYGWPEYEETPEIKELYLNTIKKRLEIWFNLFYGEYTNIISIIRPGESSDAFYQSNLSSANKHFLFEQSYIDEMNKTYLDRFNGNTGLMKSRLLWLKPTKDRFCEILSKITGKIINSNTIKPKVEYGIGNYKEMKDGKYILTEKGWRKIKI